MPASISAASTVSVVVPARDEEISLPALLASLRAQSAPPAEIVVADGGSRDRTVEVARAAGARVLELGPAYPGRARNQGIRAAAHDWVALIDAGCTADPHWLEELLRARSAGAQVVWGHYDPRLPDEWAVAQALALVSPRDPATGTRPPFVASCLIHRSAWQAAGPFPEHLRAAEDLLFFERVRELGLAVALAPRARIEWSLAPGPLAAFRRLRLYSAHHLAAGLGRTWHRRVMLVDLAVLGLLASALAWPAAGLLALGLMAARLLKTVAVRASSVSPRFAYRPDRLARVALLLGLADAAVWLGLLDLRRGRIALAP